ncbi:sensor histidine kinase [Marinivivus vitaminiproducens]|uniref:sensor histidine kinase n=1 Tax=Marinivivus vitaminiproducens TaxID=3035935 RepID=UPI00279A50C1|nr:sensor histidine kinase [Geminicoccaceae bacterium SCSIO 64248]
MARGDLALPPLASSSVPVAAEEEERATGVRRGRGIGVRLVVGASVWIIVVLVVTGFGLSALFRAQVERSYDSQLSLLIERLVISTARDGQGQLTVDEDLDPPRFAKPLSGWYWEISVPGEEPIRSRSLWDLTLPPVSLPDPGDIDTRTRTGPRDQQLYMLTRAITLPDAGEPVAYTVAIDRQMMRDEVARFNALLYPALAGLGASLVIGVILQVVFGLQPLRQIKTALSAVRSGQANRLGGEFPAEVVPLVIEINALLDHSTDVVERARTQAGNLAHGLKTPLTVLMNEALSPDGPAPDMLRRQVDVMNRHIDHHLARSRAAASAKTLGAYTVVAPLAQDLARTLQRLYRSRDLEFRTDVPEDLAFRGEAQDLEEMLGNLLENAGKWARAKVLVRARLIASDRLTIAVEDDGPGLEPAVRARALKRGQRLDETTPGTGLGLAIVQDMATLYGGRIRLETAEMGGLCAALELPAALAAN